MGAVRTYGCEGVREVRGACGQKAATCGHPGEAESGHPILRTSSPILRPTWTYALLGMRCLKWCLASHSLHPKRSDSIADPFVVPVRRQPHKSCIPLAPPHRRRTARHTVRDLGWANAPEVAIPMVSLASHSLYQKYRSVTADVSATPVRRHDDREDPSRRPIAPPQLSVH